MRASLFLTPLLLGTSLTACGKSDTQWADPEVVERAVTRAETQANQVASAQTIADDKS